MGATIQIRRWTGASGAPTKTNIAGINTRLNAEDAHSTAGTTNSILIPAAGSNYSYWASIRLYISAITGGTVNNLKWFTDGANGLGTGITALVSTAASYVQATGTAGTTGLVLNTTNYAGATTPVDPFTYTSASPLSISGSASAVGDVGDFIVQQLVVGTTANQGATPQETATFRYDDTSS
jgi:hypothetical protein